MLQIKDLQKNFLGVRALNKISLTLSEGIVAFVGDNGAGKSTLMKCISGATKADSGSIIFNDLEISGDTPVETRQLGIEMIYQNLSLCKQQDIVTNVFLGKELRRSVFLDRNAMREKCASVFEELGIDIKPSSVVGALSGGQQQLVAITRAIIREPKLLIMDEPTAALGVKEVERVLSLIVKLKNKGIAIAMVTHRLNDIFQVADRIVVMSHGEIKFDLKPQETDLRDLTLRIIG